MTHSYKKPKRFLLTFLWLLRLKINKIAYFEVKNRSPLLAQAIMFHWCTRYYERFSLYYRNYQAFLDPSHWLTTCVLSQHSGKARIPHNRESFKFLSETPVISRVIVIQGISPITTKDMEYYSMYFLKSQVFKKSSFP